MSAGRARWYVVVDVETTGPVPGPYSLAAVGAFVFNADTLDASGVGTFRLLPPNTSQWDTPRLPWSWDPDTRAWWDRQDPELRAWVLDAAPDRLTHVEFVDAFTEWLDAVAPTSSPTDDRFVVASPAAFDVAWLDYYLARPGRKLWSHRSIDVRSVLWGEDPSAPWGAHRSDDDRWVTPVLAHDPSSDAVAAAATFVRFLTRAGRDRLIPGWAL